MHQKEKPVVKGSLDRLASASFWSPLDGLDFPGQMCRDEVKMSRIAKWLEISSFNKKRKKPYSDSWTDHYIISEAGNTDNRVED